MSEQTREQQVRYRAYLMWLADGKPNGRDKEHWREAEALVDQIPLREADGPLEAPTIVPCQAPVEK